MSLAAIITIILIGIILLVLELLVVPGGVLGIIAVGMIGFGVYNTYANFSPITGHITLVVSLVATVTSVYVSLKSGAWKRWALKDKLEGRANEFDIQQLPEGKIGIALSDLRPMGTALFDDEKFEVTSEGEKITVRSKIKVLRVEGNKIFVVKSE